ncbi:MAG: response regulator [Bacteroidetes bacterium]|nr:response regulator [Bacteroidota bacterium]HET6243453.1 response regulator [Bacteroidia bacterium]
MDIYQKEILLVEDNPNDAKLVIMALKQDKVANNIIHVKDGEEALDFIFSKGSFSDRSTDNFPCLILLDLKMPKVDGIEVLQKIKADNLTKNIPVVIFTSSREDPDIKKCYELGVNSYIVKPMEFDQFAKVVKEVGFYWVLINQLPNP